MTKIRQTCFFGLSRLIGSRVGGHYREFLDLERATPDALRALADRRLQDTLSRAARDIPFYSQRVAPSRDVSLADFPVLTKTDLGAYFAELMCRDVRVQYEAGRRSGAGYSWLEVKTGGSTGVPTVVIHDAAFRDRGRASRLYSQHLCGFPFGVRYFRLWGSMAEINRMADSASHRILSRLAGEVLLNAFRMDEADIRRYVEMINRSAVRHMMAYVDAVHAMARYIRRTGSAIRPLASIMACAGTVTPDARADIQAAFGARVHNKYGSRDCADMACECDRGRIHIYSHQVRLEVVDDHGRPAPPGQVGRLLVTLLDNPSFPLIRYEIGDMAALDSAECSCGRPFPLLDKLEGRCLEFLASTRGGYVSPLYVRHLIGVIHNPGFIRRFQMVQETATRYALALEISAGLDDAAYRNSAERIRRDLLAVLGNDADLRVSRVAEIPPSASGKFLYTINRSRPAQ